MHGNEASSKAVAEPAGLRGLRGRLLPGGWRHRSGSRTRPDCKPALGSSAAGTLEGMLNHAGWASCSHL